MIERIKTAIQTDDRAVSPVIGVILMVAITVILAAVIGSFVLNIGGSLQQNTQVSISGQDSSANYQPGTTGNTYDVVEFSHGGGEALDMSNYKITISKAKNNLFVVAWDGATGNWYSDSGLATATGDWAGVVNGVGFSAGFTLSTGDKVIIEDTTGTDPDLTDGTSYVLRIVDKESGEAAAQFTFTVN